MDNKLSEKFHELIDKEFLETLTLEETTELKILTQGQHEDKSLLYQEIRGIEPSLEKYLIKREVIEHKVSS